MSDTQQSTSTDKPKAHLGNRLYIPDEFVRPIHRKRFTYLFGPEFSDDLEEFTEIKTFREFSSGYTGFARGDMGKIAQVFGDEFEIVDQRKLVPHRIPGLEFTGVLTAEQTRCWAEWCDYQYGVIVAPPRWGKSIFGVHMICRLRQTSLVLAQEDQLLDQFEEEFRKFTNVDELERLHGKKLVGRPRSADEVFPVATLATWQMYNQNLAKLRENRDRFGVVIVDEAHSASAPCFARVVNTTNPYYRIALTATPERKDGKHVVMFDVVGPVVSTGVTEQLPVHVRVVKTGVKFPPSRLRGKAFWAQLQSRTMNHERRNDLICRRVWQDIRNGHSVLIATDRIMHIYALSAILHGMATKEAEKYGRKKVGIALLHGTLDQKGKQKITKRFGFVAKQMKRKELRLAAKSGEIRIVIAYSKIVQLGWNVAAWSSLHSVMPMSNEPNWYQRVSRIRTKCANCPGVQHPDCLKKGLCLKRQPVCHIYVDASRISNGCFATQQNVHKRLGFVEQFETDDVGIRVERDPADTGKKTFKWTEIS